MIFGKRKSRTEEAEKAGGGCFGQNNFIFRVDCYLKSDLTVITKDKVYLELTHDEAKKLSDMLVESDEYIKSGGQSKRVRNQAVEAKG